MLKNYFKTAFRNFTRNKAFTMINAVGLSIGLASCFLIMLYVNDELSYDKFHRNASQIYRFVSTLDNSQNGEQHKLGSTGIPVGPAIKNEIPGVQDYVRIASGDAIVRVKNDVIHET